MYCKSANVSFCKAALTFWDLHTVLTEELYRNVYCVVVLVELLLGEGGKECVEKCYIVLSVKCEGANVNCCKVLLLVHLLMGEDGKERVEKCCIVLSVKW